MPAEQSPFLKLFKTCAATLHLYRLVEEKDQYPKHRWHAASRFPFRLGKRSAPRTAERPCAIVHFGTNVSELGASEAVLFLKRLGMSFFGDGRYFGRCSMCFVGFSSFQLSCLLEGRRLS